MISLDATTTTMFLLGKYGKIVLIKWTTALHSLINLAQYVGITWCPIDEYRDQWGGAKKLQLIGHE